MNEVHNRNRFRDLPRSCEREEAPCTEGAFRNGADDLPSNECEEAVLVGAIHIG